VTLNSNQQQFLSARNTVSFSKTDTETQSLAMRISKKDRFLVAAMPQAKCLKQPEQFEDDYDNYN
jgi:hypothetical protein